MTEKLEKLSSDGETLLTPTDTTGLFRYKLASNGLKLLKFLQIPPFSLFNSHERGNLVKNSQRNRGLLDLAISERKICSGKIYFIQPRSPVAMLTDDGYKNVNCCEYYCI